VYRFHDDTLDASEFHDQETGVWKLDAVTEVYACSAKIICPDNAT